MSRRNTNPWNTRLSAGGANKTNIQGQTRRGFPEPMDSDRRNSRSDLMPRLSNFRPLNSRFVASRRRPSPPPEQYSHWDPPAPSLDRFETRRQFYRPSLVSQRDRSPDVLLDNKGRPIPKRGMFLNAKYSEPTQPAIDEAQIRRTEEMIRRIAGTSRHNDYDYEYNRSNELRDKIRQVVYDMGVPEEYRVSPRPSRRRSSDFYHPTEREFREEYRRRESEEEEDFDHKKHRFKKRARSSQDQEEDFEKSRPGTSTSVRSHRVESRTSRNKDLEESLNSSGRSVVSKTKEDCPNTSKGSKNSSIVIPSSPGYSKDPDDDDNWKNSLSYMSKADGAGAAMFSRIGSAVPALPLKDNTRDNYSKIAMMLLNKSISEMNDPKEDREPRETLQKQLVNMSTSWAQIETPPRFSLMDEISKIQHPHNQNSVNVQMDESLFKNSKLFKELDGERVRKKFHPMYHSSPKSHDVFRSDEGLTMPSSIPPKIQIINGSSSNDQRELEEEEEEEPPSQHNVMEDYIARGASQLTFLKSPEMYSSLSEQAIRETPRQNSSAEKDKTSIHLNSRFQFSAKRQMPARKNAMLDFDEETQKMFEDAFGHEEHEEHGDSEQFTFRA